MRRSAPGIASSEPVLRLAGGEAARPRYPPGITKAWQQEKKRKVSVGDSVWTTTDKYPRSLNHFMQKWMSDEEFAKMRNSCRVLFNPAAWDGQRSHLEKYLANGICTAKRKLNRI